MRPPGDHVKDNWARNAVVYQIYPRSFKDSDNDGIGDLEGIIEKLDYLNDGTERSLGIDAIWLNPVYRSPQKDFGYDISDYYDIDPIFGNLETFDRLVREAHRRGIKMVMDFVPNHTSHEHPWFVESGLSRTNPKRTWYLWCDPKPDGSPPNNWLGVFGGSAWTYDERTRQCYLHSFLPEQPDLNWRNPEVREEMTRVLRFWLDRGVDGFRTDAIYHLIKDDKFRDDPPNPNYVPEKDEPYNSLLHIHSTGRQELFETTNALCKVLGERGDTFMVSEAYLDIPGMAKVYQACEDKLHAPFNFNFITLPWDAPTYKKFVDDFEMSLALDDIPNYVLGNHDRSRVATRLGQARARLAVMLLFSLRGMAFIYYGEELGMEDAVISSEKIIDPWGENLPGFKVARDPERTPMQWDQSRFVGFSEVTPWLPFFSHPERYSVAVEDRDPRSMLTFYRGLIHLKKSSPALRDGTYRPIESTNPHIFAFVREHPRERVLVLLNFSGERQKAACEIEHARMVCTTHLDEGSGTTVDTRSFVLRPYEGHILTF